MSDNRVEASIEVNVEEPMLGVIRGVHDRARYSDGWDIQPAVLRQPETRRTWPGAGSRPRWPIPLPPNS